MPKVRTFDSLVALSKLLLVRGDVLGRIVDHDRAELIATEAIASSPDAGTALYIRAQLAGRFHRFEEANARLDQALAAGIPRYKIDSERAALLQATGRYEDALILRERLAKDEPGRPHAWSARVAAGGNRSMGRRRSHLCGGARCRQWRVAVPVQPTAVRMGRERDALRRSGSRGGDLRRTRRDPARARSGTRTSRRSGARARTAGPRDGAHYAVARDL